MVLFFNLRLFSVGLIFCRIMRARENFAIKCFYFDLRPCHSAVYT